MSAVEMAHQVLQTRRSKWLVLLAANTDRTVSRLIPSSRAIRRRDQHTGATSLVMEKG